MKMAKAIEVWFYKTLNQPIKLAVFVFKKGKVIAEYHDENFKDMVQTIGVYNFTDGFFYRPKDGNKFIDALLNGFTGSKMRASEVEAVT